MKQQSDWGRQGRLEAGDQGRPFRGSGTGPETLMTRSTSDETVLGKKIPGVATVDALRQERG